MTAALLPLAGIVLPVAGGEILVRGASTMARSFATPTPELAVTVEASLSGRPGLAVGNVVGSRRWSG